MYTIARRVFNTIFITRFWFILNWYLNLFFVYLMIFVEFMRFVAVSFNIQFNVSCMRAIRYVNPRFCRQVKCTGRNMQRSNDRKSYNLVTNLSPASIPLSTRPRQLFIVMSYSPSLWIYFKTWLQDKTSHCRGNFAAQIELKTDFYVKFLNQI